MPVFVQIAQNHSDNLRCRVLTTQKLNYEGHRLYRDYIAAARLSGMFAPFVTVHKRFPLARV